MPTLDPTHDPEPGPGPELDDIVGRYRREREHGAPALAVARSTLEWAGDTLDHVEVDILATGAHEAIRRDGAPVGAELTGPTVAALLAADITTLTTRKPYLDLPQEELRELLAVGLVELGKWKDAVGAVESGPPRAQVDLDYRTMSAHEYRRSVYADRQGEGVLDLVFGWLPGAAAGLLLGIVTAVATGDLAAVLVVTTVAAVAGYVLTGLGHRALEHVDVGSLRLGPRREHEAWGVLYFGTGPFIALLTAWLLIASA